MLYYNIMRHFNKRYMKECVRRYVSGYLALRIIKQIKSARGKMLLFPFSKEVYMAMCVVIYFFGRRKIIIHIKKIGNVFAVKED